MFDYFDRVTTSPDGRLFLPEIDPEDVSTIRASSSSTYGEIGWPDADDRTVPYNEDEEYDRLIDNVNRHYEGYDDADYRDSFSFEPTHDDYGWE